MTNNNKQHGAVSLFVVLFAALLITVITVSFIRIMIQGQQQAASTDLSRSAYDSAQVGVEDGKRALLRWQAACLANPGTGPNACTAANTNIHSPACNKAVSDLSDVGPLLTASGNKQVPVQTSTTSASTDKSMDQAYTCVIITPDTADYTGTLSDKSEIIPLRGVSDFNQVMIEWFTKADMGNVARPVKLTSSSSLTPTPIAAGEFPLNTNWDANRSSVLRTQLMQINTASTFSLDDLDNKVPPATPGSDSNTLFLYPSTISTTSLFSSNIRRTPPPTNTNLSKVVCVTNITGTYACKATLTLPDPIGGTKSTRQAYLRLSSIYKSAHYRVTLIDSVLRCDATHTLGCIKFNGVQPIIDSTGRANTLYRRVQAKVKLSADFPYPEGEIDTSGSFCKDFFVTNDEADYNENASGPPTCNPNF